MNSAEVECPRCGFNLTQLREHDQKIAAVVWRAAQEQMREKAAKLSEGFEYSIAVLTQFGQTTIQENPYANVHIVAKEIRALSLDPLPAED